MPGGFPLMGLRHERKGLTGPREAALQYLGWDEDPNKLWFLAWLLGLSTFALWWWSR